MDQILKVILPYTGLAGLSMVVFYFLFREVLRKKIFSQLTKQHSYRLLRLALVLVWAVATTGIAVWAVNQPSGSNNNVDDLKIVDVSFDTTDDGQKVVDIKFRNIGSTVSYIKETKIKIKDTYKLKWLKRYSQKPVKWTGNVKLPDQTTIKMSQDVKSGDTDRIQLAFYSEGRDVFDESIYEIEVSFIYNETNEVLTTRPITLFLPRQAAIGGAADVPKEEWEKNISSNVAAMKRFLEQDAIRDPDFVALVETYSQDGYFAPSDKPNIAARKPEPESVVKVDRNQQKAMRIVELPGIAHEAWGAATPEQRLVTLIEIERISAELDERPIAEVKLFVFEVPPDVPMAYYGGYRIESNEILINPKLVEDPLELEQAVGTVVHCGAYAFQEAVLKNPERYADIDDETREGWSKPYVFPKVDGIENKFDRVYMKYKPPSKAQVSEIFETLHGERDDLLGASMKAPPNSRDAMELKLQLADVQRRLASAHYSLDESEAALSELNEVFASVPLVLSEACENQSYAAECQNGRRLMEDTHKLRAQVYFRLNDHDRRLEELRSALSYAEGMETLQLVGQMGRRYYNANKLRSALAITHLLLEHARDSNDIILFELSRDNASFLYMKVFTSVSWELNQPDIMRSDDPRDYVDNGDIGIGKDFKYGMISSFEDEATFISIITTGKLFGSIIPEFSERMSGLDDYIRAQLVERNFEPAAKYLFARYLVLPLRVDSPAKLKAPLPGTGWVTPDEILSAIDQAPSTEVDQITLEAIRLFVEGHEFLENYGG